MFENKKAVIFDLDGTIVDSAGLWEEVDIEFIKSYGKTPNVNIREEADEFFHKFIGPNVIRGYMHVLKVRYGIMEETDIMYEKYDRFGEEFLSERVSLKPGVADFIRVLHNNGIVIALATLSDVGNIDSYFKGNEVIRNTLDWEKIFGDRILSLESVKNKKPEPDIYLAAINKLGLKKDECIVIEDSYTGVLAASRAGIDVINIYDKYSDSKRYEINQLATYKALDYYELIKEFESRG